MPIYKGLTQNNPTSIFIEEISVGRVYIEDTLVWQKLGFEPYVEPVGFDRTAQPVDIYEVFKRYYITDSTAKYIYSVSNSFTTNLRLSADEMQIQENGTSWVVGYKIGETSYQESYQRLTLANNYPAGNYSTIQVTGGGLQYPSSGKIALGGWSVPLYHNYAWSGFFTYTSRDDTHFYGATQYVGNYSSLYVSPIINWSGKTHRYLITCNSNMNMQSCEVFGYINGPEWLYCGNKINSVYTSNANAFKTTIKYIHIHKLSNITSYGYGCHRYGSLTGTLYISSAATEIGLYVPGYYEYGLSFANCSSLTGSLVIPDNIVRINAASFYGCLFSSITISANCNYIGNGAFERTPLVTVNIPDSVLYIGNTAFANNTSLTSLSLGNNVQTIGTSAFFNDTNLTGELYIPSSIISIGISAFSNTKFSSIVSDSSNYYVDKAGGDTEVLYDISTSSYWALYSVTTNVGTLKFRNDTTKILASACYLNSLKTGTLELPNSLIEIQDYAFERCTGFTGNLIIPNNVTTIGVNAFYYCTGFNGTITIGNAVQIIKQSAFGSCTHIIGNIVIPDSCLEIQSTAFYNLTSVTGVLDLGEGITKLGGSIYNMQGAFSKTPLTGTLTIPASLTTISENAFTYCNFSNIMSESTNFEVYDEVLYDIATKKALHSARAYSGTLTIKNDTIEISPYCFYLNVNRTGTLTIPATVTTINEAAFSGCTGFIGDLIIPNTVTSIGIYGSTFDNLIGINGKVELGTGVSNIARYVFSWLNNITRFDAKRSVAPIVTTTTFQFTTPKPLHIPVGATGYNVAPWTNTAIFSSIIADL